MGQPHQARKRTFAVLVPVAVLLLSKAAHGTFWIADPASPASWHDAANWSEGVPGPADLAVVCNQGQAQVFQEAHCSQLAVGLDSTVAQDGGAMTVHGVGLPAFNLGCVPVVSGVYELSGGGTLNAANECVGYAGTGCFRHLDGSNTVTELYLAYNRGSRGTYELVSGTLQTTATYLASRPGERFDPNLRQAEFIQSGGRHLVSGWLVAGCSEPNEGTYRLLGGELEARYVGLGLEKGFGRFIHSGGSARITDRLYVGDYEGKGVYELSGTGELWADNERLGFNGRGQFIQTGGVNRCGALLIYAGSQTDSLYELHEGEFATESGTVQRGAFEQYGGVSTWGTMALEGVSSGAARFRIHGGVCQCDHVDAPDGVFIQVNGAVQVSNAVTMGHGVFEVHGGAFTAGALLIGCDDPANTEFRLLSPQASITLHQRLLLNIAYHGAMVAAPGSVIRLAGADLELGPECDDGVMGDLRNVTFVFEGGPDKISRLEAATEPMREEFRLGAVRVGGEDTARVVLVDDYDQGHPTDGREGLYTQELLIGEGSRLDCNGLPVMVVGNVEATLDEWIGGGNGGRLFDSTLAPGRYLDAVYLPTYDVTTLQVVPEPAALVLLPLAAIVRPRRRG
jgi:hypothetical protein